MTGKVDVNLKTKISYHDHVISKIGFSIFKTGSFIKIVLDDPSMTVLVQALPVTTL